MRTDSANANRTAKKSFLSILIYRGRFCACAALASAALCGVSGCAALNENPNNDRFWFPTLRAPSAQERAMRASTFPDGGDPYMNANIGPKSLSTRPIGWEEQRSFPSQVYDVHPDVDYD
ncbi:MAG: hypothetical protein IJO46_07585 [Thermoguttaceae bacterium]|nr:hypothetical protein [Thermoguttaceae bacterium]MBQ8285182.1 hypothetical protein [Thermoguttaceae bacterium]